MGTRNQTDRQTHRQTDWQTDGRTNVMTDKSGRWTGWQTDKPATQTKLNILFFPSSFFFGLFGMQTIEQRGVRVSFGGGQGVHIWVADSVQMSTRWNSDKYMQQLHTQQYIYIYKMSSVEMHMPNVFGQLWLFGCSFNFSRCSFSWPIGSPFGPFNLFINSTRSVGAINA